MTIQSLKETIEKLSKETDKGPQHRAEWSDFARTALPQLLRIAEELEGKVKVAEDALDASDRLIKMNYVAWGYAGGPNECKHGYAAGVPCRACDEAIHTAALAEIRK